MKKYFQNLNIQCWRHSGHLGFAQPCICMQAASPAIAPLLVALDELAADGPPSKRTLTLRPPQRPKPCTTIHLVLAQPTDQLREMSIEWNQGMTNLEFTVTGLTELRKAIVAWMEGAEDFSIAPRGEKSELGVRDQSSGELWFWTPFTDP